MSLYRYSSKYCTNSVDQSLFNTVSTWGMESSSLFQGRRNFPGGLDFPERLSPGQAHFFGRRQ